MFIMHDHPTSAHFAIETTFNKVRERYYWPKMHEDIKIYIPNRNRYCRTITKNGKK